MNVTLRQRKKSNKISLYLDYYSNGKRQYEYLNLYLTPEPEKGKLTKKEKDDNAKMLELAESIRSKRHLEIKNGIFGFQDSVQIPVKLTTLNRFKLTSEFAGEDFKFMNCFGL
ncbi:MAG: hypothetical protein H0W73_18550 [Bacteroidetes bacterium]|nr:hypothetical protein [Bacteroidota bacterium]